MPSHVKVPRSAKFRLKPLDKKSVEVMIEAKLAQADRLLQPHKPGTKRLHASNSQER